jgi:hypothetical protein
MQSKAEIAQRLILTGFDPAEVLAMVGLPAVAHTGLPSSQLQQISTVAPDDPPSAYEVKSQDMSITMPQTIMNYTPPAINIPAPIINVPETVVRVNLPENKPTIRTVERDADGRILNIIERTED